MKKILSLLIAFSLTFVFSVNAFATNVPKDKENISSENVYSAKASTAGGSDSGYFHGDGHLYINMRETNRAVDVYVQVVSSTKEDMNQTYYVAWNTPSGKSYVLSAVKGDVLKIILIYMWQNKELMNFISIDGMVPTINSQQELS